MLGCNHDCFPDDQEGDTWSCNLETAYGIKYGKNKNTKSSRKILKNQMTLLGEKSQMNIKLKLYKYNFHYNKEKGTSE